MGEPDPASKRCIVATDRCGAKTRAGTPCRRGRVAGRARCKFHGGASTGAKTPKGRARVAASGIKHGLYATYLSRKNVTEAEVAERAKPDLVRELVVMRTMIEDALSYEPANLKERAAVISGIDSLVGRVTRIVEGQQVGQGTMNVTNTLNVTLGSLSTAELETVVRVLGDPTLAPLQRLLVPLLDSGQLVAARAVEQSTEHGREHGSTVRDSRLGDIADTTEHEPEHDP